MFRVKMVDVMLLYLFLCDISCHMHHGLFCHTHLHMLDAMI